MNDSPPVEDDICESVPRGFRFSRKTIPKQVRLGIVGAAVSSKITGKEPCANKSMFSNRMHCAEVEIVAKALDSESLPVNLNKS